MNRNEIMRHSDKNNKYEEEENRKVKLKIPNDTLLDTV